MPEGRATSVGSKLKEVGRHSVVYGLGSIAQSAVQFVLIPMLTAAFTLGAFGAYSLVQMVATISSSLCFLGMTSAMPRSYFDYQDPEDRKSVFTTAFLLLLVGAALQVLIGVLGGRLLSRLVLRTEAYSGAMGWAMAGGALAFINTYFFTWLRFLRKSLISVGFSILTLAGSIGLSAWFIRLHPGSVTAPFVAICLTQGLIMAVFLGIYGRSAFTTRILQREVGLLLAYGIPNVLTGFAAILIDWSDRIVIERSVSLGDAGLYSAAFRLGALVNVLLIAPFGQIWSPMMIEYRRHDDIREFYAKVTSYFFLLGSLVLIVSALFIRNVLPVLIRSQLNEAVFLVTLFVMAGYLIYGYTNICAAGLIYERKIHQFAYVYYAVAVVKLGLNTFVIPAYALAGAAATTLLANILVPVSIYALAKRYFSIAFEWRRIATLAAITAVPFGYAVFLERIYPLGWPVKAAAGFLLVGLVMVLGTDAREKAWVRALFTPATR